MGNRNNTIMGILAILLGLFVIAFPLFSVYTASFIAGIGIFFLGIWMIVQSFQASSKSMAKALVLLVIGLFGIVVGIGILGKVVAFGILASFGMYIAGILLIISGALSMFPGGDNKSKGIGGMGIIIGFLVILLGFYAWNPFYLALLIGFGLILFGFAKLIETTDIEEESEE